jgi:hypothetical protein
MYSMAYIRDFDIPGAREEDEEAGEVKSMESFSSPNSMETIPAPSTVTDAAFHS